MADNRKKVVVQEPPIIDIGNFDFGESRYQRGEQYWMASTLYRACMDQCLDPFELPLAAIDLSVLHFSVKTTDEFIWQMKRCRDCDTDIPIILDDMGQIADGTHRICKAILDGKSTILAYRLQTMPDCDFIGKDKS